MTVSLKINSTTANHVGLALTASKLTVCVGLGSMCPVYKPSWIVFLYRIYLASWPSWLVTAISATASSPSTRPTQTPDSGDSTWFVNRRRWLTCWALCKRNGEGTTCTPLPGVYYLRLFPNGGDFSFKGVAAMFLRTDVSFKPHVKLIML